MTAITEILTNPYSVFRLRVKVRPALISALFVSSDKPGRCSQLRVTIYAQLLLHCGYIIVQPS